MPFQLVQTPIVCVDPTPPMGQFFSKNSYSSVVVLVDENTHAHCYPHIESALPPHQVIKVPAGEAFKTLDTCQSIWNQFMEKGVDRRSLVVVLGGGVLGDMGGFCAATFKRGVDCMLIPTTLLAQVDAGLGGKMGVNLGPYKNQVGVFQEPALTLVASKFLDTLPRRALRCGFAEIVKHALIADAAMWDKLRSRPWDAQDWAELVPHSAGVKLDVVRQDPEERGLRKALNFGHTIGHAIESVLPDDSSDGMMHGEAVAAGMIMEAYLSARRGYFDRGILEQIVTYLLESFGKWTLPTDEEILDRMRQDKKNEGDRIMTTLLHSVGKAVWDVALSVDEIQESIAYYRALPNCPTAA